MSATLSAVSSQPLFTIEQIELVRRLRNSGMTKERIIEAYESLERMDGELGSLYNVPRTLVPTATSHQQIQQTVTSSDAAVTLATQSLASTPVITGVTSLSANSFLSGSISFPPCNAGTGNVDGLNAPNPGFLVANSGGANFGRGDFVVGNSSASSFASANSNCAGFSGPQSAKRLKMEGCELEDTSGSLGHLDHSHFPVSEELLNELDTLLRNGFPAAVVEIRKYVNENSIKQTQIAQQSNINQPYISRFLRGDGRDMSERSRCSIYLWYLRHKKGMFKNVCETESVSLPPASTLLQLIQKKEPFLANAHDSSISIPAFPGAVPVDPNQILLDTTVKRERFTFRAVHLDILEEFFANQQYPTTEERDILCRRCNEALRKFVGHDLIDREMMMPSHVANWFSNRRKEIKRVAREEGISTAEVVLPSRNRTRFQQQVVPLPLASSPPKLTTSEKTGTDDPSTRFDAPYAVIAIDGDSPIEIKEEVDT